MSNFSEIKKQYMNIDVSDLTIKQQRRLSDSLKSVKEGDLSTLQDHLDYILLIKKFRAAVNESVKLNGANYVKTLANMLSVGADGIYTRELRFIFELIQNVDDCTYKDLSDCKLDIHFDYNASTITFSYNETGFRPFDVFSITGIAEASKNTSTDSVQIGEKGIGFKSVFGVADKVLIQSGKFSFALHEDNITIPQEEYNDFTGVEGTKLTLYLKPTENEQKNKPIETRKAEACQGIYDKLVEEYSREDALFTKNPILFLNKLTKIRMFVDGFDSLEFSVSKTSENRTSIGDLSREDDVVIASVVNARKKNIENKRLLIECTRYKKNIVYSEKMWEERYEGQKADGKKTMQMQVIFPKPQHIGALSKGAVYSFLPTQIKTVIPLACHIPFKLDVSREYIDDQKKNSWFEHSCKSFSKMMEEVYVDYAKIVKQDLIFYLPTKFQHLFEIDSNNSKLVILKRDDFKGNKYFALPVFYTSNGKYKKNHDIYSFDGIYSIVAPEKIGELISYKKELYIPPVTSNKKLSGYDIELLENVYQLIFERALYGKCSLKETLDIIDKAKQDYSALLENTKVTCITSDMLEEIAKHDLCFEAFRKRSQAALKTGKTPEITISNDCLIHDVKYIISTNEPIGENDFDKRNLGYLKNINFQYITLNLQGEKLYFAGDNVLVLSEMNPMMALAEFCRSVNENSLLPANLTMRNATIKLNNADESLSVEDYMRLLRDVRSSLKIAHGNVYNNYLKIIRELSTDPYNFIRELVQNADDCEYEDGVIPEFKMLHNGKTITTEYNEKGFTKQNVRSITAIGESTKKKLNNNNAKEIGEKGIGFKTVFAKATSVEIHSNQFHFKLSQNTPTIPEILDVEAAQFGTKMIFRLANNMPELSEDDIVALCFCLRKLKHIKINSKEIFIEDVDGKRIITVNNHKFAFDKFTRTFEITDKNALAQRSDGGKNISSEQEITIYIPERNQSKVKYFLYSGLPTRVGIHVNLIIDAPFELTASRDNILENKWNEYVCEEMYIAYADMLEKFAPKKRTEILSLVRYPTQFGPQANKVSLFKGNDWLNKFDVNQLLKNRHFIPTLAPDYYGKPFNYTLKQIPEILYDAIADNVGRDLQMNIVDDRKNAHKATLDKLGCNMIEHSSIARYICKFDGYFTQSEDHIKALYKYLEDEKDMRKQSHILQDAKIVPIKSFDLSEETVYIDSKNKKFYYDKNTIFSTNEFIMLETGIMSPQQLSTILNISAQELNEEFKNNSYRAKIENIIKDPRYDNAYKHRLLLEEMKVDLNQFKKAVGILRQYEDLVPLLMNNGLYKTGPAYLNEFGKNFFAGDILKSITVSSESKDLAILMGYKNIRTIVYEDLNLNHNLDDYDIEDFMLPELEYGRQIIEKCIRDGYISEEQIELYELYGIQQRDYSDYFDDEDFPTEPVIDLGKLQSHIRFSSKNISRIEKVEELRTVPKIRTKGKLYSMDSNYVRTNALNRYRPSGNTDACFCQMCKSAVSSIYLNTNSIFVEPKYYWPQSRISLCFNCSKKFTQLRSNSSFLKQFHSAILSANVNGKDAIAVKIGDSEIHFTQTHLAELQEIIRTGKY